MRRLALSLLAAATLLLAFALPADAAAWTPPAVLSPAGAAVGSAPSVALNDAGAGVAAWIEDDGGASVVRTARHLPGGAWVTDPTALSPATLDACDAFASIDQAGNALVVWAQFGTSGCHTGAVSILFATRGASDAAWSSPASLTVSPLIYIGSNLSASSNAAGQMAVGYSTTDGQGNDFVWGDVGTPAGGFPAPTSLRTVSASTTSILDIATAIGPAGDAGVIWQEATNSNSIIVSAIKAPGSGFFFLPIASTFAESGRLAFDGAGDMVAVYRTLGGSTTYFASRYKPAGQPVGGEQTIAVAQSGFSLFNVTVGIDASGAATAAWMESGSSARQVRTATRPAGAASAWSGNVAVIGPVASNQNRIDLREAPSGAAVIGWNAVGGENDAIMAYRPAGQAFGAPVNLGPSSIGSPDPAVLVAIAPGGDALAAWAGSADARARVAVFDAHAPAITAMDVPAMAGAGTAVAMSGAAGDAWGLAAGQPAWSFGDGGTAAGGSVSHTFAAAGTYTVTLGAADAAGNAATPATRTIVVTAPAGKAGGGSSGGGGGAAGAGGGGGGASFKVTGAVVKARYTASKLHGEVTLSGTIGTKTHVAVEIRRTGTKQIVMTGSDDPDPGPWTRTLGVQPWMLPGTYTARVSARGIGVGSVTFTIAAPKSGVADRATASAGRRGPAATRISQTSELWAHFHLAALPKKGQALTTRWILPSGRKLATNTRPRTGLVEAQVKDLKGRPLAKGTWRCVLQAGGAIVATVAVKIG